MLLILYPPLNCCDSFLCGIFPKKLPQRQKMSFFNVNFLPNSILRMPEAQAEFEPFKESASGFPIIEALVFLSFFLVLTLEHFMNGIVAKQDAKIGHEIMMTDESDTKKLPLLGGSRNSVESGNVTIYDTDTYVLHNDEHANKKKPNKILPYLLVAGLGFHAVFEGLVLGLGTNFHGKYLVDFVRVSNFTKTFFFCKPNASKITNTFLFFCSCIKGRTIVHSLTRVTFFFCQVLSINTPC